MRLIQGEMSEDPLEIPKPQDSIYARYIKRILDIILSGVSIICLSPLLITIVVLELIFHGRPVMYVSKRPGKDGVLFDMLKFRSMTNECDESGVLLPASKRLTSFGRFLRRTSLDELAGLFCIFTGSMSVIGPRPLLPEYLTLYNERHKYRHSVRPGLVCVKIGEKVKSASKTRTWYDQFENDIFYVENLSFLLDAKMVLKTLQVVFIGSDMRTNADRVKFDGKNLHETRLKSEIQASQNNIKGQPT